MARVTSPLLSVDASGTFGKTLTYGKWKGRNYCRQRVIPANPKSDKQTGVRSMMKFLAVAWATMGDVAKATYDTLASQRAISAFNAFISVNLARWQNFQAPTQSYPAAGTSTALSVTTMTLTGGVGEVSVQLTPSGATNIWGYVIFRGSAEITVPSWTNAIAIVPANGATPVTYVDTPVAAGTHHYRAAVINNDGVIGTIKADATATAT